MGASFSRIKIRSLCIFIFVNAVDRARGHRCVFSNGHDHHNGHLTVPDGTASIPRQEYELCDGITGVTFNTDGALKVIGDRAFYDADGFTELTIPASVTRIGDSAFIYCDELARVVFDTTDGLSELESIGIYAFLGNDKLEVVEIPESVTEISFQVLNNCPLLNRVIVNGDSTWTDPASLANLVYSLCDSTESHVLNNVAQACIEGSGTRAAAIIGHASNDCNLAACLPSCPSSSSAITIPDGTESIPLAQYFECVTITSVTFNTDGLLKKIDNYAFEQADGLTEVMIPSSVTSIGTTAFYSCDELVQAVFDTTSESSELRFIGPYAFAYNAKLAVVEIPESVTEIGQGIIDLCTALNRVIVQGSGPFSPTIVTDELCETTNSNGYTYPPCSTSLTNLVASLCNAGNACIEGSGSRAADIINHENNNCNLVICNEDSFEDDIDGQESADTIGNEDSFEDDMDGQESADTIGNEDSFEDDMDGQESADIIGDDACVQDPSLCKMDKKAVLPWWSFTLGYVAIPVFMSVVLGFVFKTSSV